MKLRKLEEKDIPWILEWMKDPEVNCFFRFDPVAVTHQTVADFVAAAQDFSKARHYACVDDNDIYLGTISLKNINEKDKNAEYAISFRKAAQGNGAAKFATLEILRIAFEEMSLARVYLNVLENNARARKFYEKCGFRYEGTFQRHLCIKGVFYNLCWYGFTKGNL
ncbi:MAG: GNAT family N-acetyltransferase [Pygmaiobacter massiliensis]